MEQDARDIDLSRVSHQEEYFPQRGWTDFWVICPSGKSEGKFAFDFTPRFADPRPARGTTALRPDAAGRFFPCRRDRRVCGRRAARDDSRAPTAAWSPTHRAAVSGPARPAARWSP